ncbi:hypothetical protein BH10ACI2_BH10ACI2_18610 [soil metagenome]
MNVEATIDLDQMTVTEKIRLMELLWRDISKEPENVPIPDWHIKVLEERDAALANGETSFIDFEEAIADIRHRAEVVRRHR